MESKYTNKYDNAYSILEKLEQGGSGGGGKVVLADGIKLALSTFSTVPENLDFSKVTEFNNMFYDCDKLTTVGNLETSNGTNFNAMFYQCYILSTVSQINTSKGTDFGSMFGWCTSLKNLTLEGSINYSIDFNKSTNLTYDSIKSILTAASNTTNTNAKTLGFSRTIADNNGELTALIGECTTKGWAITGLTLE